MNIFKILANGDGTINEANISAFLGYILDPYQDHGLGHEFLKRFLSFVHNSENINFYAYDYEIELEQAFRDGDNSKQIVDIVIACFPSQRKNLKESITIQTVQSSRNLERIYLIENKVTYNAKKAEQLKNQFNSTIKALELSADKVFPIYLTPDIKTYHNEFDSFEAKKKNHFVWIYENELPINNLEDEENSNVEETIELLIEKKIKEEIKKQSEPTNELLINNLEDEKKLEEQNTDNNKNLFLVKNSIYKIIKDIISDESKGQIEAINEYTIHTLKSFVKFIENEFKSEIQELKDKKDGKFQPDISNTLEVHFTKYKDELNEESNNKLITFNKFVRENYKKLHIRHSTTHPIAVMMNQARGKIFGFSKPKSKKIFFISFLTKTLKSESVESELLDLLRNENLKPEKSEYGYRVYENLEANFIIKLFEEYINILRKYNIVSF